MATSEDTNMAIDRLGQPSADYPLQCWGNSHEWAIARRYVSEASLAELTDTGHTGTQASLEA